MHDPCTRQPLLARENNTETPSRGTGVEPAKHPPKVKSGNLFTTLECQRGVNYAYLFVRVLGPFYSGGVLPPFLVEQASSLQSKSLILVEQASHSCRASFSSLQSKPLILAEQVSHPCRASFSSLQSKFSETWWASLGLRPVRGPREGWALPSSGLWTWAYWARQWAYWARQALSHILSSSVAPFTPFGPSLLCKRSIGVTVKTNNNGGPVLMRVTDRRK